MRILIAEDDHVSRLLLVTHVRNWGHEAVIATDGVAAWRELQEPDAPSIAILDWMMPGMDGLEICRRARARPDPPHLHLIMLTARADRRDVVEALRAGADDYVTKPFDAAELRARVDVGIRVLALQAALAARVAELERALAAVDTIHGILPVCSYCKKVRGDADSWQQLEAYVTAHSAVRFNHGVCPDCKETIIQPQLDALRRARAMREKPKP